MMMPFSAPLSAATKWADIVAIASGGVIAFKVMTWANSRC